MKDLNDKVHRVNDIADLFQFGFLVMGPGQPKRPPRYHRPAGPRPETAVAGSSYAGAARRTASGERDMEHFDSRS